MNEFEIFTIIYLFILYYKYLLGTKILLSREIVEFDGTVRNANC